MTPRTPRERLHDFVWFWFLHRGLGGKPPPGCLILFALALVALALVVQRR